MALQGRRGITEHAFRCRKEHSGVEAEVDVPQLDYLATAGINLNACRGAGTLIPVVGNAISIAVRRGSCNNACTGIRFRFAGCDHRSSRPATEVVLDADRTDLVCQRIVAVESMPQAPLGSQRPGAVSKTDFQPETTRCRRITGRRVGRRQSTEIRSANISPQITEPTDNVRGKQAVRKEVTDDVEAQFQVLLARKAVNIVIAEQALEPEVLAHLPADLDLPA